jgi:hydrogenase nickel incorporation protein HypB
MIGKALAGWDALPLDILFIENVGNLICPAEYDLGEDLRVALTAVTEGEDKPLKYPLAFNTSHVAIITKTDIAEAVGFDRAASHAAIRSVHPAIAIVEVACRTGEGMDVWYGLIGERLAAKREELARV